MTLKTALLGIALACAFVTQAPAALAAPQGPPPAITQSQTETSDPATGMLGQPPEGMAQIVVFRPSAWGGGAVAFTAKEGDRDVFKLGNGSYTIIFATPGRHAYSIKSETTDTLTMEVDAGETYYVIETLTSGLLLWRPHLNPSDEATFRSKVAKLRVSQWRPAADGAPEAAPETATESPAPAATGN